MGQEKYVKEFVESIQSSSPQGSPNFMPQWKGGLSSTFEMIREVIEGKLVKLPGPGGKDVYWILRNTKKEKRKSPDSVKFEMLVSILGKQGGANFTQARDLSQDEWQTLKLPGKNSDYYLVKVVEKENWRDELPQKDWSSSFCYLFVAGLLFSKIDTNVWNTGFIDGIPVGLDSDKILEDNSEARFFQLFIRQ